MVFFNLPPQRQGGNPAGDAVYASYTDTINPIKRNSPRNNAALTNPIVGLAAPIYHAMAAPIAGIGANKTTKTIRSRIVRKCQGQQIGVQRPAPGRRRNAVPPKVDGRKATHSVETPPRPVDCSALVDGRQLRRRAWAERHE